MEENTTGPNYLAILTVGWCYVFSARLVGIQGKGAIMRYMRLEAERYHGVCYSTTNIIDIWKADESVARWWSAVLAPHEGGKLLLRRALRLNFLRPGQCHARVKRRFPSNGSGNQLILLPSLSLCCQTELFKLWLNLRFCMV